MFNKKVLQDILTEEFSLKEKEIKKHESSAQKSGMSLAQYLVQKDIVEETGLYQAIADRLHSPFVSLQGKEIKKDVLNLVPPALAQTHNIVAFEKNKNTLSVAMLDPEDIQTIEFLKRKTGLFLDVFLTTPSDVKDALRRYHAELDQDIKVRELDESEGGTDQKELKKAAEEVPIINIVNSILEHAVYENASDIHIEPTEQEVVVRFRVDGVLQTVMSLPKSVKNGLTARAKILANLKIDEHMLPQDGRFKIMVQDEKYSFRVSIMPVYDGEKIVLRLLHDSQKPLTLDELGFLPTAKTHLEKAIKKPHGIILVTGPTGSGKTTTLYSVLGMLNQPDVNISTIEDPIEYHVNGINQSQVNTRVGYTFEQGLRSFLRQDPDIIMVGEIRDRETAEIAMHAAMTGHLVLSTLHTNDAVSTIARLLDMGIPGFLLSSTINVIIGQRLLRRLETKHAEQYTIPAEEARELSARSTNSKRLMETINSVQKTKATKLEQVPFFKPNENKRLQHGGYKGRVGIYEVLPISEEMQNAITKSADTNTLRAIAEKEGLVSMFEDGMTKAAQGMTSIEEVLRVTQE